MTSSSIRRGGHARYAGRRMAARRMPPPAPGRLMLHRAVAWATADLPAATAARTRRDVMRSPARAALYAYALGYWEGGVDMQALAAAELAAFERQIAASRAQQPVRLASDGRARNASSGCPQSEETR